MATTNTISYSNVTTEDSIAFFNDPAIPSYALLRDFIADNTSNDTVTINVAISTRTFVANIAANSQANLFSGQTFSALMIPDGGNILIRSTVDGQPAITMQIEEGEIDPSIPEKTTSNTAEIIGGFLFG